MHTMNDYSEEKAVVFNNKVCFLQRFEKYVRRDWLDVANSSLDQFSDFILRHTTFVVKPQSSSCGKGVRIENANGPLEKLYEEYRTENALLEEVVVQHSKMASIYSGSVNTLRIAAVRMQDSVEILGAVLRCGSGSGNIDNYHAGGFAAKIDPETGVVVSDGCNMLHERVIKHPDTKVLFHGFQIPYWSKVLEMINNAAKEVDGVRYVGWDVAIREDGPLLIEGNFEGMFDVLQQPANQGIKSKVLKLLKEESQ